MCMLRRTASACAAGGVLAAGAYAAQGGDEGRRSVLLGLARADEQLRPALAALLPAEAFVALYSASRTPFLGALAASAGCGALPSAPSIGLRAMGLSFRNDLGNAAGLDKDGTLLDFNYALGAGYAVVGTVLSDPHSGNLFDFLGGLWRGNAWTPLPSSGGALNSLGLPSKGVEPALRNIAAFRERHGVPPQRAEHGRPAGDGGASFPVGVSIMGHPAHSDPADKLEGVLRCVRLCLPLADFIEINESCPNVHHGGGHGGDATAELRKRLEAIVAERDAAARGGGRRVPLLVKLGDLGEAEGTVRFLSRLGIDGVVALNTQKDYASFELPPADRALLDSYTARYGGGLSGPPILDRSSAQAAAAQAAVRELGLAGRFAVVHAGSISAVSRLCLGRRLRLRFVVVHVGGVQSAADVQRSRATGAELRQWYTGLMHGLARPEPDLLYERVTAPERHQRLRAAMR